jgi:small nuclear ribonucleoprotein (snRNP)-like protein
VPTTKQSHRSFFKTLVEHEITVELKNEVQIRGTLKSVDQYLNIKLDNAEAVDEMRWPHLVRHKLTQGLYGQSTDLMAIAVLDKRHVHPRLGSQIRAPPLRSGRYGAVGGCNKERGRGGEEQGEVRWSLVTKIEGSR